MLVKFGFPIDIVFALWICNKFLFSLLSLISSLKYFSLSRVTLPFVLNLRTFCSAKPFSEVPSCLIGAAVGKK